MPAVLELPAAEATIARPIGQSERWDAETIALLSLISLSDTSGIASLWDQLAPKPYRGLLLALAIEDVTTFDGALPLFWWDVFTQRYGTSARGRIREDAIFGALEAVKTAAANRQALAVAALFTGAVEIGQWQTTMAEDLKVLALLAAALGRGGVGNLVADDFNAVTHALKFHLTKLERYARQIERGVVTSLDQAGLRSSSYAVSVTTGGYDSTRVRSHIAAGFDEEFNVLDDHADHCEQHKGSSLPDCPSLAELGWVKIGTLPTPGSRVCLWNCKCRMKFRRSGERFPQ